MSTKLYTVTASFQYVIVVEDDQVQDPNQVAEDNLLDAFDDTEISYVNIQVEPHEIGSVDGWYEDSVPYGSDSEKTIAEYL